MAYSIKSFMKGVGAELNRVLNREVFLHLLDLEVKRSRRYQNFFCILILRLKELPNQNSGKGLQACYQRLSHLLVEEVRDSDVLGSLGEKRLAVILPYADMSSGDFILSRFESNLRYHDFAREGFQVVIEKVCFPCDAADTSDLLWKVVGAESASS